MASLESSIAKYNDAVLSTTRELAKMEGRAAELSAALDITRRELSGNAELLRSEVRVKRSAADVAVLEGVVKDLDTYYKALDGALARYHRLKSTLAFFARAAAATAAPPRRNPQRRTPARARAPARARRHGLRFGVDRRRRAEQTTQHAD